MKNLIKSALVALSLSVFVIPATAGNYGELPLNAQDTIVKKDTVVKEEASQTMLMAENEVTYVKIEVAEVPEAVTKAVAAKYEGYVIGEAYKGSDNSYKLVIKKESVSQTVYFNEAGEFQKEETAEVGGTSLV